MTIKEYIDDVKFRNNPEVRAALKDFKRSMKNKKYVKFEYRGIPCVDINEVIQTFEDFKATIELIDDFKENKTELCKVLGKRLLLTTNCNSIYRVATVQTDTRVYGGRCFTHQNKYILAKGNEFKGFFNDNLDQFYESPKVDEKPNIYGVLPLESGCIRLNQEELSRKYPEITDALKRRNDLKIKDDFNL